MQAIDSGDTAWLLFCTGMVMLMAPAVGLFYGGLVRRKNMLTTLVQSLLILALVSVMWALIGYSLAFGPDINGLIGGVDWLGLAGVGGEPNPTYAPTVPHYVYMLFQMMFAVVTPALIIGAVAERMKFGALVAFVLGWSLLVYSPVAHWVWGDGGWLRGLGTLDFAGGTAVHTTAGIASLVVAAMLGRRLGFGQDALEPADLSMTALGGALLWFGWFGFNGGSALGGNALAGLAVANTHLAASTGALTWIVIAWMARGRASIFSAVTGGVAGLVAITPASGYVTPLAALGIGAGAGVFTYLGIDFCKSTLGIDDALDVFGVHGIGGVWGMIATGLFATRSVNPQGADGLFAGGTQLIVAQLIAVAAVVVFTAAGTWIVTLLVRGLTGLRVDEAEELRGLDAQPDAENVFDFPGDSGYPQRAGGITGD